MLLSTPSGRLQSAPSLCGAAAALATISRSSGRCNTVCACVVLSLHWQPPRHLSYSLCDASFDTFRQLVFVDE